MASEANCTVLLPPDISGEPRLEEDIMASLESQKVSEKIGALKEAISLMLQGEHLPRVLMCVIRFCITQEDHFLKKMLMIYWEIVPKYDGEGKLLPEMILVCNALRNDLNHPNEFIRGCMLRFMCKLKEPEILEPLVASIKANLEHRNCFVRRNAVLAVWHIFKAYGDQLLPDGAEVIEAFLVSESDEAARRNAFLALADCDGDAAVRYLFEHIEEIGTFGDGFAMVVLDLSRRRCRSDPSQRARFIGCVFALRETESSAVAYEAAWTLVTLSKAPSAIRSSAETYCKLLDTMSDNNVKLIVLDRLQTLRKTNRKVLEESLMDIMRTLSVPNSDIRQKTLDIAMELVSSRSITQVVDMLKREIAKTQDPAMVGAVEYRQALIKTIHQCAVRFPDVAQSVVHLLMDFVQGDGAIDVIQFVRTVAERYPPIRRSVLEKLVDNFAEIKASRVSRVALWVLGEYCEEGADIEMALECVRANMGSLPLEAPKQHDDKQEEEDAAPAQDQIKSVLLSDGTYGTERIAAAAKVVVSDAEVPNLRKLLLGGDTFLGATLGVCMTKLALRAADIHGAASEPGKAIVLDVLQRLAAIAARSTSPGDAPDLERLTLCVRSLAQPATAAATKAGFLGKGRAAFTGLLAAQEAMEVDEEAEAEADLVAAQADDLISFRQLRGTAVLASNAIDVDEGGVSSAIGVNDADDFTDRLNHIHQLSGFADPVYAEAFVSVHDYDIVLEILVINRTTETLHNLQVELATMGDLKIVERPVPYTIGPLDQRTIRANIKVASTETGHIFGTIVYDENDTKETPRVVVNLNDIHLDIMDYIQPATTTDALFRAMWAEFEWENKVAVTTSITDVGQFMTHIVKSTNMKCMTPQSALGGDAQFLAANLYAKSIFGEDALVNVSVEKQADGKIVGYIRIRSKTQGIALSLGDRITAVQRGPIEGAPAATPAQ